LTSAIGSGILCWSHKSRIKSPSRLRRNEQVES
jgi:hypothetical protein